MRCGKGRYHGRLLRRGFGWAIPAMMQRSKRVPSLRWATAAFVALQLVISSWSASGLVLCRAEDGHTTMEVAHEGARCLSDYRRHHPADPAPRDFEEHGCSDTVLSTLPISVQRISKTSAVHPPVLASLVEVHPAKPASGYTPASPVVRAPYSATSLRTIVLLI
jgi:hypothetical protein